MHYQHQGLHLYRDALVFSLVRYKNLKSIALFLFARLGIKQMSRTSISIIRDNVSILENNHLICC